MSKINKEEMKGQYGRVKGAEWFPLLHKRDIMVLGQGGIGSWLSLLLGRIGCTLHTYDMDTYEEHNLTGQLVGKSGIGVSKVEAVKTLIADLSPDCRISTNGEYCDDTETNDIVVCGFDNMIARKLAFYNWKEYVDTLRRIGSQDLKDCFFQDGRLLAEHLQIFSIPGEREDLIEKYEKGHLFDDSEVAEAECTFKQTSHCAAMIAAHMVGFLTNWATNVAAREQSRHVPFFYEYFIPINLTTCLR